MFKGHAGMSAHDKIGLAGAVNALSAGHRDLRSATAASSRSRSTRLGCTQCIESSIDDRGLDVGILIGDGKLNYREEKVLEAYYADGFNKWTTLND